MNKQWIAICQVGSVPRSLHYVRNSPLSQGYPMLTSIWARCEFHYVYAAQAIPGQYSTLYCLLTGLLSLAPIHVYRVCTRSLRILP